MHFAATAVFLAGLVSCSGKKPPDPAAVEARAAATLQTLPAADAQQYQHITDMRQWRNPYLILRTDGAALLDASNHEEHMLKPQELLAALAKLPASAWPYGRMVAVQEQAIPSSDSEQEKIQIRRNRGIVAGTLQDAHILIRWVPAV